jgi:hypothetical protein
MPEESITQNCPYTEFVKHESIKECASGEGTNPNVVNYGYTRKSEVSLMAKKLDALEMKLCYSRTSIWLRN